MSDYEQAVFISYAWKGESEEMVNLIERSLRERGIHIVRDKRDLRYKGSIGKFMERIGRGACVIVVISDKYLRSPNCMFELVEIAENKNFLDRIFPVVLADADIYRPSKQIQYIKYWEKEISDLKESLKDLDPTHLEGIYEQLNLYDRIRDNISRLTLILSDMNTLTPDVHRGSDFGELYAAIEKRIRENRDVPTASFKETIQPGTGVKPRELEGTIDREYFEPETILIPAGPFLMGSPEGSGAPASESPQHTVNLPACRIGKYPVTNSQYEEFIREKHIMVTPVMGWEGQRVPAGLENHPLTGVTWFEAMAYCQWLTKKTGRKYTLPNEAQWEKACRGGGSFIYPWGNEFLEGRSNHGSNFPAPVDAHPAQNELGCFDMVGNVRQWTCSLWGEKRSQPDAGFSYPWKDDQRNSLSANRQIRRVVRGSSMRDAVTQLRCSFRSGQSPDDPGLPGLRHGFRVVIDLEER